jgi:hypothetical protein
LSEWIAGSEPRCPPEIVLASGNKGRDEVKQTGLHPAMLRYGNRTGKRQPVLHGIRRRRETRKARSVGALEEVETRRRRKRIPAVRQPDRTYVTYRKNRILEDMPPGRTDSNFGLKDGNQTTDGTQ